ncbi:MAG: M14 family metallopeptidase [Chloroflexota bacterium]
MKRKRTNPWVVLAWSLNIAGLLAILGVVTLYLGGQIVRAAQPPALALPTSGPNLIATAPESVLVAPTARPRLLPSVTPNPNSTPLEPYVSPTAFFLTSGREATIIGFSVQARPIEVYTFGQGEKQRMIVAGIHGGYEWNTIALADLLITYLDAHPEAVPSDITLYVLRNLNPDGDATGHKTKEGRSNANGVDLNRNFPTNWAAEWNRDGCWNDTPTTGGTGPGSEPETKALMRFLAAHRIDALISYHSAALGIFPGGEPWDADSKRLAQAIANVSDYPYPPIDTGCVYTGTLADYAVALGAAAVDMELTNHYDTDYEINLRVLKTFLNWIR